jgi:hypothetical protein
MSQTHYPVNYSSATTGDSFSDPISLGDSPHRDFGRGVVVASPTIGRDYEKWDLQWLRRFPGYVLAHDPAKERSWWW